MILTNVPLQSRVRELELSSKRTLAREVRQAEEKALADLAAAKEAHEKAQAALQSKVAALERENAKNVVSLRQVRWNSCSQSGLCVQVLGASILI
jgi:hypothetical protein